MIVIDGKAHRNMPEQVAKNQKDIEDIFNTLDGLNIQDNVVAIADLSHMLTQDELVIVERAVAFIVYNDHLFIKRDQDATNAYFDIVFSISGSTVISFNSDEMQVNLTTGALNLVSNTFTTYSKTELDTQLGAKASVSYVDTQLALKADKNNIPFENIKDAQGHNRFVDGNGITATLTGLTITYCKWSLSGTHLMFVCAGNVLDTTTIPGSLELCRFNLPEWVYNKIYAVWGGQYLESKNVRLTADNWTYQQLEVALRKITSPAIQFLVPSALTLSSDRSFRIQFDLLIDNE